MNPRRVRLPLTVLATAGLSVLLAVPSAAQLPVIGRPSPTPTPTPTPTQSSSPTPTPTRHPSPTPTGRGEEPPPPPKQPPRGGSRGGTSGGGSSGGTRPSGGSSSGGSTGSVSSGGISRAGTGATPWGTAVVVGPPSGGEGGFGLQGWATREKTPPRTTTELLELLGRIHGGVPTRGQLAKGFGRFPIQGYTWYQDDYGAPRALGRLTLHAGIDLFAERGTPVAATIDGVIWKYARGGRGGNAIWLLGDDGVRYYYGHMDRFAFQPRLGRRLKQGEIFGFVGATGSAVGTPPHVHFEVNPGGRGTVNPKAHLDRWLDDAIGAARKALEVRGVTPVPGSNAGWAGILELLDVPTDAPAPLWLLGVDPTSTAALADDAIDELLSAQSWRGFVDDPFAGATGPEPEDPLRLGLAGLAGHHGHDGHGH